MEPHARRPRPITLAVRDDPADACRDLRRPLEPTLVDLTGIGLEIAHSLGGARRVRDLDVTIETGLVATADRELSRLLLEHLLHRAVRRTAGEAAARIELMSARHEEQSGPRRLAVFVVRDNGQEVGVDDGLALASRIVERHGGRFRAVYGPVRGTSLYFALPRARSCTG